MSAAQNDIAIGFVLQCHEAVDATAKCGEFYGRIDLRNNKRDSGAAVEKYHVAVFYQRGCQFTHPHFFRDMTCLLIEDLVIIADFLRVHHNITA